MYQLKKCRCVYIYKFYIHMIVCICMCFSTMINGMQRLFFFYGQPPAGTVITVSVSGFPHKRSPGPKMASIPWPFNSAKRGKLRRSWTQDGCRSGVPVDVPMLISHISWDSI